MATTKATFTLDAETVGWINDAAERLHKPKSQVVREAVADYHRRTGRLTEAERQRMLRILDTIMAKPPSRPQREVDQELAEIRRARRAGGRRSLSRT